MAKIYALFKDEERAKNAVGILTKENKNAKIDFFSQNTLSFEQNIFNSDINLIGSPVFSNSDFYAVSEKNSSASPGLSAFVFGDFVMTSKNAINDSAENELKTSFPADSYAAGLKVNVSLQNKSKTKKLLSDMGALIV